MTRPSTPATHRNRTAIRLLGRVFFILGMAAVGCRARSAEPTELAAVSRQVYLMGTVCSLTARGTDRRAELVRLERFVEILEASEAELSTWREDTPLNRFNQQPVGLPHPLDPSLCRLLAQLFDWNRRTDGAFDPAIGPLIEAWAIRGEGQVPNAAELGQTLQRSGLKGIYFSIDDCSATRVADTWIDSGAFGKGEALDRLRDSPEAEEGPWLIDLGGQVAASEALPGDRGWNVDLADPVRRESSILTLELRGGSLATSGGSERDLESDGKRVGHILDPRTGLPASFHGSVTVWHESGLVADILSTALYVLGPGEGLAWAERNGVAVLFLERKPDGEEPDVVYRASSLFRKMFPIPRRNMG